MKIAIVGYGGMGRYHFERIKKVKGLEVKGAFDTDKKRKELAKSDGIIAYKSYKDITIDKEVEGVLIATPNDSHAFYMNYFAENGKKVLCEKPVTNSYLEFLRVLEKNDDKAVITVNQNRRQDKDYATVKEIIKSEKLGKIYRIESRVTGANGVPGGWRKIKKQGGGMMLDWGVHLIDQMLCMYPVTIKSLSCRYSYALGFDIEDGFNAVFNLENGVEYIIEVQTNDYIGANRWQIYGRDGSAVIKNWKLDGEIITPVYNGEEEIVSISAGNGLTKTMAYRAHGSVERQPLPSAQVDGDDIYKNFAIASDNTQTVVKHNELLKVLKVMDLCKRSAKLGGALIKVDF